jgi:IS1 family transposase
MKGIHGNQYTFTALCAVSKAILAWRVGRREIEPARAFMGDLRQRVLNAPQINTDGFSQYEGAVEEAFGADCHYGQIIKTYGKLTVEVEASRRYSPNEVTKVSRRVVTGDPKRISTSYVERSNLTFRMQSRRFTRLTNGFSKKLENHVAAVGLFCAHYNLFRAHEAHRVTPAMRLGVTDHVWTISEVIEVAETGVVPGLRVGRFVVIKGNRPQCPK